MSIVFTKKNGSMGYQLPYRTLQIIDLSDTRTYALICAYQVIFVPCVVLGMKELVLRHYRLIRLTEGLENNFNYLILQQLLGTTIHICISGYYLIMVQIQ
ncbi:odorant receptor 4-like [Vespula maculifrons]|uniref:Odorant receptor 4-like n=1 Tax=Vespula maculifrons TaxID=7453 RepID=A0ABD2BPJ7_VESMC